MSESPVGGGLSDLEWQTLLQFKGYGNPAGRFWFIGIEERGDGTVAEYKVRAQKYRSVMDLQTAMSPEIWPVSKDSSPFQPDSYVPTWATMIRLALRLEGQEPKWDDPQTRKTYQRLQLGTLDGDTFLTDLLPLPKAGDSVWPDWWPFDNWDAYAKAVLPTRIAMFRDLLRTNGPSFVFCYGKSYWSRFKELFSGEDFTLLPRGTFQVAHQGSTTVVLTPFFSPRTGMTISQIDLLATSLVNLANATSLSA
jgi:hypothetical protein